MITIKGVMNSLRARKKAQVWVSAILYILIITIAITLILQAGLPLLTKMKDRASFTRIRDLMTALDQHIRDVASEGQGSQRVIPVEVTDGKVVIENDKIRWELETKARILEPRSKIDMGNLIVGSNIDVSATETADYYILQNTIILVNISKRGTSTNYSQINTSSIINSVKYKDKDTTLDGTFIFKLGNDATTESGNGYTKMYPVGNNSNLDNARVVIFMNTTNFQYDLEIKLDSQADFFAASVDNVVLV